MSLLNPPSKAQNSSRLVMTFFIVATIVTAIFYSKLFAGIFQIFGVKDPAVLGRDFTNSTMFALFATVASLYYAIRATVAYGFVQQVADELVKVTWPNFEESKLHSKNTIVVTFIISLILFFFDSVFGELTSWILQG
jgi:preprotein translocase subunit SecE